VDQALHTCNVGLLASMGIDHEAFKRYAIVVIEEALKPLEDLAKRGSVS